MDVEAVFKINDDGAMFAIRDSNKALIGTVYVTPTRIEWYRQWPSKDPDDSITWEEIVANGHRFRPS